MCPYKLGLWGHTSERFINYVPVYISMAYTEIKERAGKKYYYRVKTFRKGKGFQKKRVYLGVDLDKKALSEKESEADRELRLLSSLLSEEEKAFLEDIKKKYHNEPKENFENRYEVFCSQFTYDSDAIEGNTLTLQQTSMLLFENIVPSAKSMREVNEALNHKKAFDFILNYKEDITRQFILDLHSLVVKETLREDLESQIGKYRTVQVYIRGAKWTPPKPEDVPNEMKTLLAWYTLNEKKLHPLILASYFHAAFEQIHPFVDGNGRVGRLLMNFILHKNGYPMINIPNKIKQRYYSALEKAHLEGDLRPFIELLIYVLKNSEVLI
jgi:Fic family protein